MLLQLTIKRGALIPFYPDLFVACLGGCDAHLLGRENGSSKWATEFILLFGQILQLHFTF